MKKDLVYVALAFASLSAVSCSDDELVDQSNKIYQPGDEIKFTGTAVANLGDENARNSRTIYGDVNKKGDKIELKWLPEDMMDIACQEAKNEKQATYQISNLGNDQREASIKCVSSQEGLQWSDDPTEKHHFYASYPSNQIFQKYNTTYTELVEKPSFKIDALNAQATGFMPQDYTIDEKYISCKKDEKSGQRFYTIKPNMDFAYMVANKSATMNEVNNGSKNLSLNFVPLATALEFDITANDITDTNDKGETNAEITLQRLEFLASDQNITGNFVYDFKNANLTNTSTNLSCNELDFYLDKVTNEDKKIKMIKGDVCNITAFMIPSQDFTSSSLKVKIWYKVGNKFLRYKMATIGKDIKCRYKYYFKNFKMPKIKPELLVSTGWYYIKFVTNGKYLTASEGGEPLTLQKKINVPYQMWKLVGYEHTGKITNDFSFRIQVKASGYGKYAVVHHTEYVEGKNQCIAESNFDRPDYFKLYKTQVPSYKDKDHYYELMYDYNDQGALNYKNKCLKYYGERRPQLGLGEKDCIDNVVEFIPVTEETGKKVEVQ